MASRPIRILLTLPRYVAQEYFTFTSSLWGNATAPDHGGRKMTELILLLLSNSKEPQQKYRLGTVSIKILGGLHR